MTPATLCARCKKAPMIRTKGGYDICADCYKFAEALDWIGEASELLDQADANLKDLKLDDVSVLRFNGLMITTRQVRLYADLLVMKLEEERAADLLQDEA